MDNKQQRIFRVLSKKHCYQNPWVSVTDEEAVHDVSGNHIHYNVVRYNNPSVVVLVHKGTQILVEEIERYPIDSLS